MLRLTQTSYLALSPNELALMLLSRAVRRKEVDRVLIAVLTSMPTAIYGDFIVIDFDEMGGLDFSAPSRFSA